MGDGDSSLSISEYLIFLFAILSLSLVAVIAWLRAFVFPRIKEDSTLILESPQPITGIVAGLISKKLEIGLASGAVIIYLAVRFIGLDNFPIYFFSDEAAQTVLAEKLIENDFRIDEEILPTYFYNVDKYSLSVSVYLQVIPYLVFGKSIWVTRGTAVLITLVGVASIGLMLKQVFQIQYWWLGILVLSITPTWFLHSRTAFETTIATAFYGGFIYAYLLYLYRSPRYLYVAVFVAAITFYSYNPARMVILVTGGLFFVTNLRFHRRNWRVVGRSLVFAIMLTIPYLRFQYYHIFEDWNHLVLLDSYWTREIQFTQKLLIFGREYFRGLSIEYWYCPKTQDIPRHVMKGYGHFLWVFFPFMLVGIWMAIRNWKVPAYRVLLIALVSSPVGGALVENFVTRSLFIVIPVTFFTTIGMIKTLSIQRNREWQSLSAIILFIMLGFGNCMMLGHVLSDSALWFNDYGLYGMQYGAQQVFSTVNDYLVENPELEAVVSHKWLNGPDMVMRFFVQEPERVNWVDWETIQHQDFPLKDETIFLVTNNEWENIMKTHHQRFLILIIIPFPDDSPAFYFFKSQEEKIQPKLWSDGW